MRSTWRRLATWLALCAATRQVIGNGLQLLGGYWQVLPGRHPGIDDLAQPALLEGLHQPAQTARLVVDQLHDDIHQAIATATLPAGQRADDRIEKTHVRLRVGMMK